MPEKVVATVDRLTVVEGTVTVATVVVTVVGTLVVKVVSKVSVVVGNVTVATVDVSVVGTLVV